MKIRLLSNPGYRGMEDVVFPVEVEADTRDGRVMLWLHNTRTSKVALFHPKTAITRIKRLTTVAPGGLNWSPEGDLLKHATNVELIENWS